MYGLFGKRLHYYHVQTAGVPHRQPVLDRVTYLDRRQRLKENSEDTTSKKQVRKMKACYSQHRRCEQMMH